MRSSAQGFGFSLVLMVLSACATSGRVDKTFTPNHGAKTLFGSEPQPETEARYIKVIRLDDYYWESDSRNPDRSMQVSNSHRWRAVPT